MCSRMYYIAFLPVWMYQKKPNHFYLFIHFNNNRGYSYNEYTQIAARAVCQLLKEEHCVAAEKRGLTSVRYQCWEDGKGGEQMGPSFFCVCRFVGDTDMYGQVVLNPEPRGTLTRISGILR